MTTSIISKTCEFVENKLAGDGSGHDWWHIFRVWTLAKKIATEEKAQLETVELGALLHDIADWKFHNGDDSIGPAMAQEFLSNNDVDPQLTESVVDIVSTISYKGAGVATPMKTLEEGEDDDEIDYLKGKTDFDEIGYGGPAPPNGRHTYIFKAYALDNDPNLKKGYSKQELEDAMKGHILAEAKLTGTFTP